MRADQNSFVYVDDELTHVKIRNSITEKVYDLPLVLVEFANVGVLRLSRMIEGLQWFFRLMKPRHTAALALGSRK